MSLLSTDMYQSSTLRPTMVQKHFLHLRSKWIRFGHSECKVLLQHRGNIEQSTVHTAPKLFGIHPALYNVDCSTKSAYDAPHKARWTHSNTTDRISLPDEKPNVGPCL